MTAVMVLGGGCREHAIIAALAASPSVSRVLSLPSSESIDREIVVSTGHRVEGVAGKATDPRDVLRAVRATGADLVVIGPAGPSVAGVADELRRNQVRVCGASAAAAALEASKAVGLSFMERHDVPAPRSRVFRDADAALEYAAAQAGCAVKLDGFAGGAGVFVCHSAFQAVQAVELCFRATGEGPVIIQELCEGPEFSVHALVSDGSFVLLDSSQDYKRLLDGDHGPNTGGVGSVSPVPWLPPREYRRIAEPLVRNFTAGCVADGLSYRGVVYFPVMLTASGPRVLEINVRFGNPEVQSLLSRLDGDILPYLDGCATATLAGMPPPAVLAQTAVTVAACVSGYPGAPRAPVEIDGLGAALDSAPRLYVSSGVKRAGKRHRAWTGRVLTVTGMDPSPRAARAQAYAGLRGISYPGLYFRTDIAGHPTPGTSTAHSQGCGVILLRGGTQEDRSAVAAVLARVVARVQQVASERSPDATASAIRRALASGDSAIVTDDAYTCAPADFPHAREVDIAPLLSRPGGPGGEAAVAEWVLVRAFASARTSAIPGEPTPAVADRHVS
jgi:phosphoribosylamine--glycine ligase